VTETIDQPVEHGDVDRREPCICESYARTTERAALAAARWLGRADEQAAEDAATSAMATTLKELPIEGRVVIGGEDGSLAPGTVVGLGGPSVDLAIDPLEGGSIVARGGNGAMSLVGVGEPGSRVSVPVR
jgi:fructose-1,6-bisphosphatase/sedoheptulose 1,7-bisphosphatase-like protein